MARNDGRVEKGQSIRSAFSAKAWNRAQDAADIVLGVQPGIEAGDLVRQPARLIVSMRKLAPNEPIYAGHAVLFYLDTEQESQFGAKTRRIPAAQWPAGPSTFADSLGAIDSHPTSAAAKSLARQNYASHLGRAAPLYTCAKVTPVTTLSALADDFFPNIGVAVSSSPAGQTAVDVCISGPAMAYVRFLFSYQFSQGNLCAIRPRQVQNIGAPYNNADGCLDAHRGGNIRILHIGEQAVGDTTTAPAIILTAVML